MPASRCRERHVEITNSGDASTADDRALSIGRTAKQIREELGRTERSSGAFAEKALPTCLVNRWHIDSAFVLRRLLRLVEMFL